MHRYLAITLWFVFLFIGNTKPLFAQLDLQAEDTRVVYNKSWALGFNISSTGFGLNYRHTKITGEFKKFYFEGDLQRIKHPKEVQRIYPYVDNPNSYVYGLKNVFLSLRAGAGYDKLVYDKAQVSGIEIHWIYGGGLSLGLLKPVYLDINEGQPPRNSIVTEKYNPAEHDVYNIIGGAGFFTGLGETVPLPGVYGKTALNFDFSSNDERIKAVETGVVLDLFPKKVPQFAVFDGNDQNKVFYITFYAAIMFGKKK